MADVLAFVGVPLFLGGLALALFGWKIYEMAVWFIGLVIGLVGGWFALQLMEPFTGVEFLDRLLDYWFLGVCAALGGALSLAVERFLVASSGFIVGMVATWFLVPESATSWLHPVAMLGGVLGAMLFWWLHRFVIIVLTSSNGAFLASLGILLASLDAQTLFQLGDVADRFKANYLGIFLVGVFVQYGGLLLVAKLWSWEAPDGILPDRVMRWLDRRRELAAPTSHALRNLETLVRDERQTASKKFREVFWPYSLALPVAFVASVVFLRQVPVVGLALGGLTVLVVVGWFEAFDHRNRAREAERELADLRQRMTPAPSTPDLGADLPNVSEN